MDLKRFTIILVKVILEKRYNRRNFTSLSEHLWEVFFYTTIKYFYQTYIFDKHIDLKVTLKNVTISYNLNKGVNIMGDIINVKVNLDYVLKYLEDIYGSGDVLLFLDKAIEDGEIDE